MAEAISRSSSYVLLAIVGWLVTAMTLQSAARWQVPSRLCLGAWARGHSHGRSDSTLISLHAACHCRLVGDCDYAECSKVAGAITPVPGGVGPMTIAMLLRNTVDVGGKFIRGELKPGFMDSG